MPASGHRQRCPALAVSVPGDNCRHRGSSFTAKKGFASCQDVVAAPEKHRCRITEVTADNRARSLDVTAFHDRCGAFLSDDV